MHEVYLWRYYKLEGCDFMLRKGKATQALSLIVFSSLLGEENIREIDL
jgi:hypothetical protein